MGRRKHKRTRMQRMIKGGLVRLVSRRRKPQSAANGSQGSPDSQSSAEKMVPVHVPSHLDESNRDGAWFRLGGIMSTILVLGLAWIALVWWLVSRMPLR